jgi:hypothetical protein
VWLTYLCTVSCIMFHSVLVLKGVGSIVDGRVRRDVSCPGLSKS